MKIKHFSEKKNEAREILYELELIAVHINNPSLKKHVVNLNKTL